MSVSLIIGCLLGLLLLVGLVAGVIVIMRSGPQDAVASARQGWLNRRSDKDEEGW